MIEFDMRKHHEYNSLPVYKVCNHDTQAGTVLNDVGGKKMKYTERSIQKAIKV